MTALKIVEGLGGAVQVLADKAIVGGKTAEPAASLDCGESGLSLRMFAPIAALFRKTIFLSARGSLLKRPMEMVEAGLISAGAFCRSQSGFPPLVVRGPLLGGPIELDGSISSQHVTGFLMALPLVGTDSDISVKNPKSTPYLSLTLDIMTKFGVSVSADFECRHFFIPGDQKYRARPYSVAGDWSAAAFLLVAGAVAGQVTVIGLDLSSRQADMAVIKVIEECGAKLSLSAGQVRVGQGALRAFDFNADDVPDLVPPLAVLACYCRGKSLIRGTERLRFKESGRVEALFGMLGRMGACVRVIGNALEIVGAPLRGGKVDSYNDHRIAMAAAVAALGSRDGVEIQRSECVAKSYPAFFEDLERLTI